MRRLLDHRSFLRCNDIGLVAVDWGYGNPSNNSWQAKYTWAGDDAWNGCIYVWHMWLPQHGRRRVLPMFKNNWRKTWRSSSCLQNRLTPSVLLSWTKTRKKDFIYTNHYERHAFANSPSNLDADPKYAAASASLNLEYTWCVYTCGCQNHVTIVHI